jgi:hypothetical protein
MERTINMSERKARALRKLFSATTNKDNTPHTIIKIGQRGITDQAGNVEALHDINRNFTTPRNNMYRRAKRTAKGVAVSRLGQHFRANIARAHLDEHIIKVQREAQPKGFIGKLKRKVKDGLLSRRLKAQHKQALTKAHKPHVRYI